jgi:exodeoxyribonuclease VII large subunit
VSGSGSQIPLFGAAEEADAGSAEEANGGGDSAQTPKEDGPSGSVREPTPDADSGPEPTPDADSGPEPTSAEGGDDPAAATGAPASDPDAGPGETPETAVSVSELNATARRVLEESFPTLWVAGEVANWTRANSGHCYFTLRDEEAQLSCVLWRSDARRLPTDPEEGMEVCARGQVSLYETRGAYQLVVRELQAKGEGLWRLAFEKLKRKLAAEGLLDDERKRPLPRVPLRVGVVTSRTGAAVRDVVSVIRRRAPWTRVLVSHGRVQGDGAADEIVAALDRLVRDGRSEVIVVTRGGGSVEDLWAFNEEPVARAVAGCPIPVVSAVGHEVDVTITDLVADRRAPTPSAAGEVVVPEARALRAELRRLGEGLVYGLRERTRRGRERAERAAERLVGGMTRRLERWEGRLERLGGRLDALSPLGTLARGFAVAMDADGSVLRSVGDFVPGHEVRLRVVDGQVTCEVRDTERLDEELEDEREEGGDA